MDHDRDPSRLPHNMYPPLVDKHIEDIVAKQDMTAQIAGGGFSIVKILEEMNQNGLQWKVLLWQRQQPLMPL